MRHRLRSLIVFLIAGVLLLGRPAPAHASIPTQGEVVLIFVGVGAVGAAIGITAYHYAHKSPSVMGCVSGDAGALTLQSESDHKQYKLSGNTTDLKAGERVRVSGRKQRDDASTLVVERLRKDYGTCSGATH